MAGATSTSRQNYGTHMNLDTIATLTALPLPLFGEERVLEAIRRELIYHNEQLNLAVDSFTERTTDPMRTAGGSATYLEMDEVDELGFAPAQKSTPAIGQNIGFPVRKYAITTQWTKTYLQNAVAADLAITSQNILMADRRNIYKMIRQALFRPTNYTFTDRLFKGLALPVKALANADSFPLLPGPHNEYFNPATHNHYAGISAAVWNSSVSGDITTSAAALASLIANVTEHYANGDILVYINAAQFAAIQRMTANFNPYVDVRLAVAPPLYNSGMPATYVNGESLNVNPNDQFNRPVGIFGNAVIWIKPWIPAGYIYAFNNAVKPLAYRERAEQSGNLSLEYENDLHPLRASTFEREAGIAVQDRIAAAVLYVNPANTNTYAWSDSTIVV